MMAVGHQFKTFDNPHKGILPIFGIMLSISLPTIDIIHAEIHSHIHKVMHILQNHMLIAQGATNGDTT